MKSDDGFGGRTLTRLLTLLVAIGLTSCIDMLAVNLIAPFAPNLKMPEFGASFDADTHGVVTADAAKLIIYRDPEIDERIKYFVRILPGNQKIGVVFAGAFLEATRAPDTLEIVATRSWWNENPPAGQSILERMELGEPPPAQNGRTTRAQSNENPPAGQSFMERLAAEKRLDLKALAGTITYLRLERTVTEEIKTCAESAETIDLCTYFTYATLLEIVPPDKAQRELAGLKETVYAKAKQ